MSEDGRFSGSFETPAVVKPADQDHGFFAPAAATQAAPPSQFGAPPPHVPFGAPAGYGQPPYPPVQRRGLPVWAIVAICVPVVVVVLGVLAAIAIPVFLNQRSTPVMPDSIRGVARSTDPAMTQAVDTVRKQLTQQNPGRKVDAAGYGTIDAGYLLIGMNLRVDAAREFGDFGITSALTSFGDVQCGTSTDHASLCLHAGTRGTIEVAQFGGGDVSQLAAETATVWSAQHFGG